MFVYLYVHECTLTFLCKYRLLGTLEGLQQIQNIKLVFRIRMKLGYLCFQILLVQDQSQNSILFSNFFLIVVLAEKLRIEWDTEQKLPVPARNINLKFEIF